MIMVIVYDGSDDGDDACCCCTAQYNASECACAWGMYYCGIEYNTP